MNYPHTLFRWTIPLLLTSLVGLTLLILACGGDDEPAATQAPATAAPAPATQAPAPATAMPATPTTAPTAAPTATQAPRATAAPTATQAPRATATPTATATQEMVEKIPVSPRLIVSVVPPSDQHTMAHAQAPDIRKDNANLRTPCGETLSNRRRSAGAGYRLVGDPRR